MWLLNECDTLLQISKGYGYANKWNFLYYIPLPPPHHFKPNFQLLILDALFLLCVDYFMLMY